MTEIRSCAAYFARLVAPENAPNREFGWFAARFIRENQITTGMRQTRDFGDR